MVNNRYAPKKTLGKQISYHGKKQTKFKLKIIGISSAYYSILSTYQERTIHLIWKSWGNFFKYILNLGHLATNVTIPINKYCINFILRDYFLNLALKMLNWRWKRKITKKDSFLLSFSSLIRIDFSVKFKKSIDIWYENEKNGCANLKKQIIFVYLWSAQHQIHVHHRRISFPFS